MHSRATTSARDDSLNASRPRSVPVGRLFIDGLELHGYHGVFADERTRGSVFRFDVQLGGDFTRAAQTDQLSDTVDLAAVVQQIRDINQHRQYNLIESLADAIALSILKTFPGVDDVTVHVRKLQPQGAEDAESSGVEVRRWRT